MIALSRIEYVVAAVMATPATLCCHSKIVICFVDKRDTRHLHHLVMNTLLYLKIGW